MNSVQIEQDLKRLELGWLLGKEYKIESLAGDASLRKYFRLTGSRTVIACYASDPEVNRRFHQVQNLYRTHQVSVPEIHTVSNDYRLIIQQDVGEEDFLQAAHQQKLNTALLYEKAIEIAARIQMIPCQSFPKFDQDWRERERLLLLRNLQKVNSLSKFDFSAFILDLLKNETVFDETSCDVAQHRDFHGRNMHIFAEEIFTIDFQDTFISNRYYDLASLIYDPYAELGIDSREQLREKYIESNEKLNEIAFCRTAKQRLWKAIGTYLNQFYSFGKKSYLIYIPRATDLIQSLGVSQYEKDVLDNLRGAEFV